jgi:NhaA family Na+:H+ antiporter
MRRPPADTQSLPAHLASQIGATALHFMHIEAFSGVFLLCAAIAAMLWANSPWSHIYEDILRTHITLALVGWQLDLTVHQLINDGLMTIFFVVVGMEIKREVLIGELSNRRAMMLPVMAAVGGMAAPALIYLAFNAATPAVRGWGIPMGTDIAFAIGALAILGRRIPPSVKVFLLALAIVDDLGAVLIIAIFYTSQLHFFWLLAAAGGFLFIALMQTARIRPISVYVSVGIGIWYAFYQSGVHPTIAGVLLGVATPMAAWTPPVQVLERIRYWAGRFEHAARANAPARERNEALQQLGLAEQEAVPPLYRLEDSLHLWVAYAIMPLFALANAGVHITGEFLQDPLALRVAIAVALGLLIGKPLGITALSWLAIRLGLATLPRGASWRHILGVGIVGGIGFTVALFIANLSFTSPDLLAAGKIGALSGSIVAGVLGLLLLRSFTSPLRNSGVASPQAGSAWTDGSLEPATREQGDTINMP